MGNSKSQPKDTPISLPRGDIFGQPKQTFNRFPRVQRIQLEAPKYGNNALQILEQPRVPSILTDIKPTTSVAYPPRAYQIWRGEMDKHIRSDQMDQYQANIDKHAREQYEFDRKVNLMRLQREKAINESICNQPTPKPRTSLNAICDLTSRFINWHRLDKLHFAPKPDRPELTDDMLKAISNASIPQPANEVLAQIDGVDISRKDIYTLTGSNWLNDEVINAYMFLIVTRGKQSGQKSVYAFNTFFYPKLRDSGYASVKRWTRKVDIFCYDLLLAPIHLGNHWCLAVVDFKTRTISYYDSMGGGPHGCCDTLLDYLRHESNDKKKQSFDDENWRLIDSFSEVGIPNQTNHSDCGVFACTYAEHITRRAKLNFTQKHMSYFRKKMIYELITKELMQ